MSRIINYIFDKILFRDNITIARKLGVKMGKQCRILSNPYSCFGSEPYLVEIGDNVEITNGCHFITHDGAVWVLRNKFEDYANKDVFGKIVVGNNVFIGLCSTILPGVKIGDNVIVGAGAVVTKDIPNDEVWAGVPAKRICSLEEYKEKVLVTSTPTKGMNAKQKEAYLRTNFPEWFE